MPRETSIREICFIIQKSGGLSKIRPSEIVHKSERARKILHTRQISLICVKNSTSDLAHLDDIDIKPHSDEVLFFS